MNRIIPMTKEEICKYIHNYMPTVGSDWSIDAMEKAKLILPLPGRDPELPDMYVPLYSYSKWYLDPIITKVISLKRLSDEYMAKYDLYSRYRIECLYENGDKINFGLYVSDEPVIEKDIDELEL